MYFYRELVHHFLSGFQLKYTFQETVLGKAMGCLLLFNAVRRAAYLRQKAGLSRTNLRKAWEDALKR
jgi:hypothetical protein